MKTGIKICGVTQPDDIEVLNAHQVDMAGFVFYKKSPRHLSETLAPQLAALCRPDMMRVALLVDPSDDDIDNVLAAVSPHYIQLHGEETPERVAEIKYRSYASLIKAIPIGEKADLARAQDYDGLVDMFLFDAKPSADALPGGNGESFDWHALSTYEESLPYLLAGGLSADNVGMALRQTGAPMVDISSGVESAPGQKDKQLIAAFVAAVRAYDGAPEKQVQE